MKYVKVEDFVSGILSHNKLALSKAITLIESEKPEHKLLTTKLLNELSNHCKKSIRIGITGVPGAGKSTFIESLGCNLISKGRKVAVLAIDPSSSISGGSILADKTRMEKLSSSNNAFIRPSPSATQLGGVAKKTKETILLCEAAGFDTIIVETVGVGQSEVAAAYIVDFFLVLMLPNAGDELQGIKKGILELADAIVINKADINKENALLAKKIYENARGVISSDKNTNVLICSALNNEGVAQVWSFIYETYISMTKSGELANKRNLQEVSWMWKLLEEGLKSKFLSDSATIAKIKKYEMDIKSHKISPSLAAETILSEIL